MLTPAHADARAVNHRRIAVWRAIVGRVVLGAIDHRRSAIIPSIPIVMISTMIAVPIRVSRYGESPEGERRADSERCREPRRLTGRPPLMNVVSRSRNAIVGPARHVAQRAHVREELNTTSAIFFCASGIAA